MTLEQFIADTLSVTSYLRNRFGKEKIYLMAHSGGTFIGLQAAARAPELYDAYIGVAQMVHQLKSERLAYEHMLGRFKETGDSRMVRDLEAAPVTMTGGTPKAYLAVRDRAMHRLGVGTTHDMKSVLSGVCPAVAEEPAVHTGGKSQDVARQALIRGERPVGRDAGYGSGRRVTELALPAYFFHGIHDYTSATRWQRIILKG